MNEHIDPSFSKNQFDSTTDLADVSAAVAAVANASNSMVRNPNSTNSGDAKQDGTNSVQSQNQQGSRTAAENLSDSIGQSQDQSQNQNQERTQQQMQINAANSINASLRSSFNGASNGNTPDNNNNSSRTQQGFAHDAGALARAAAQVRADTNHFNQSASPTHGQAQASPSGGIGSALGSSDSPVAGAGSLVSTGPQHDIQDAMKITKSGRLLNGSKRAEQNRNAQRAFRLRKEQYVKDLEAQVEKINDLVGEIEGLRKENQELKNYILTLQSRLIADVPELNIKK